MGFADHSDAFVENTQTVVSGARVTLASRFRLLERLSEGTLASSGAQRLTVVRAPMGYGKSATVADWLGNEADGPHPVLWVHSRADTAETWGLIAAALAAHSEGAAQAASDPLVQVTELARNLRLAVTLVIDDFHLITSPATDMAIATLSSLTPNLTLVVVGRRVTLLGGPLVTATTRVRMIGPEDLRYTPEEISALTTALGVPPSDRLRAMLDRTEGWPLALRAVLNLGSDTFYTDGPHGLAWVPGAATAAFDPLTNLDAFAMGSLAIMDDVAQRVVVATALVGSLSIGQVRGLLKADADHAENAVTHLYEIGFLMESHTAGVPEYSCHRAVRASLAEYASTRFSVEEQRALFSARAEEIYQSAPFSAFRLFCAAEVWERAEDVLADNFTIITDEIEETLRVLRAIPEPAFELHPTLTAALLFLENPRPEVSPARLNYLHVLWKRGLDARLGGQTDFDPTRIHLQLLCQAMVMNRVLGKLVEAHALMIAIEERLEPDRVGSQPGPAGNAADGCPQTTVSGSLLTYYRELAGTAIAAGDFPRARRLLQRLRDLSERKITSQWHGFPYSCSRTVTDPESGRNWLQAALSELAFTEVLDGHMLRAQEALEALDTFIAQHGGHAPGLAWVGAEVARAHVGQESRNIALLDQATRNLALISDRLEPWSLLLLAQTAAVRYERGTEHALAHLLAGIRQAQPLPPAPKSWAEYLVAFEAMLNEGLGNLERAREVLTDADEERPVIRLELTRLALFSGEDVEALHMSQNIGDPELTKRQRIDRRLLTAVSAWGCGREPDAFAAIDAAASLIEKYGIPGMLVVMPFTELREVAVAARDAGRSDIVDLVDAIPEHARAYRYERLTEMELRTLQAISEHRNANQAAASLFVTPGTVKKHLAAVYRKLGVRDRDAAILRATRMGLF